MAMGARRPIAFWGAICSAARSRHLGEMQSNLLHLQRFPSGMKASIRSNLHRRRDVSIR